MTAPGQHRRFYQRVDTAAADGGFAVLLDGRSIRTPAGRPLVLPSAALATAIAGEWDKQDKTLRPHTMPLMQLAATALDRVGGEREAVIDSLMSYAEADTLCYWAEEPADLVARQHRQWQPLLDWAEGRWGVRLLVRSGVTPFAQPPATIAAMRAAVAALDDLRLTTLAAAVQATGSLVIGLALIEGFVSADAAFALALLDEEYQAERWGRDPLAEGRRQALREEIGSCAAMCRLLSTAGEEAE